MEGHMEIVQTTIDQPELKRRNDFYQAINKMYEGRKDKPLWSSKRIKEVIKIVEDYKSAPVNHVNRSAKQYYYGNKYDVMTVGMRKTLIDKSGLNSLKIIPAEDYYSVLTEVHRSTGHGRRGKILHFLKTKSLFIPLPVIEQFLKLCKTCTTKKSTAKKGIDFKPVLSNDFNSRGQVNFVDLQSTPFKQYKWLMHFQDHATKFSFLRPLTSKRPAEVATELLKIFLEVGCPSMLQSDNGHEFTAEVIKELTLVWPSCKIINGHPCHPEIQGSVEGANRDIGAMLNSWLIDNKTNNWPIGCYFVQYQKNTSLHLNTKRTPYKALFGMDPKTKLPMSPELLEKLTTEEDRDNSTGQFTVDKQIGGFFVSIKIKVEASSSEHQTYFKQEDLDSCSEEPHMKNNCSSPTQL